MQKTILVTGSAGFIGYHICKKLIGQSYFVIGIDNINNYYDVKLKKARLNELVKFSKQANKGKFIFCKCDLNDKDSLSNIFEKYNPKLVINLAAQAGVRYSIDNPSVYLNSNILGFGNLLENCKRIKVDHLLYASSSSVYGGNTKFPFSEKDYVDNPVSIYAATKKANELMAHSYSHLFKIPSTGIRFFTVYGPWGRPDMAPMIFTESIISSKPIRVFNNGDMFRDFTYIDDVTECILRLITIPPKDDNDHFSKKDLGKFVPYRVVNLGCGKPIKILDFIEIIEKELKINASKIYEDMQLGDIKTTFADSRYIEKLIGYKPNTSLKEGVKKFISWYKNFYT